MVSSWVTCEKYIGSEDTRAKHKKNSRPVLLLLWAFGDGYSCAALTTFICIKIMMKKSRVSWFALNCTDATTKTVHNREGVNLS